MARTWSIVLGIGLIILGLAGLSSPTGTWIAWLDIAGGIISFLVAAAFPSVVTPATAGGTVGTQQSTNTGGIVFICAGLFAMWIIGLATQSVTAAMAWWNFGFACAYGLLAIGSYSGRGMVRRAPPLGEVREQQGPRRIA